MRKGMLILGMIVAVLVALPVIADELEDGQRPVFVDELMSLLQQEQWNASQIRELLAAADRLDWDGTDSADPAVVALALQLGHQELEAGEQAIMALDLALTAVQMQALGYDERTVARAVLRGVRDAMADVRDDTRTSGDQSFGLQVRDHILAHLELDSRVELSIRGRDRARAIRSERVPGGAEPVAPPTPPVP
jgi:hypothetical protein